MKDMFHQIAAKVSFAAGSASAFLLALLIVILWASSGPFFDFSDTWQLVINTGTTIGTFLMVFLIQNTQNRDGKAMQLKLDELIRATRARDTFIDIEDLTDEELAVITAEFKKIHGRSDSPALRKFHKKLEAVHSKRNTFNDAERVAGQFVSMLNPFGSHDESQTKKPKK